MKSYFLMALISLCSYASADIYKWVDESGRVHFGDTFATETKKQTKVKAEKINVVPPPYINEKITQNPQLPNMAGNLPISTIPASTPPGSEIPPSDIPAAVESSPEGGETPAEMEQPATAPTMPVPKIPAGSSNQQM